MLKREWAVLWLGCSVLLVSGCTGLAKGAVQAILEQPSPDDVRMCRISGPGFPGVSSQISKQDAKDQSNDSHRKTTKVLMVHGIGEHLPGYSTRMAENLTTALGLTRTHARAKEIEIIADEFPGEVLGNLNIRRHFNEDESRELLFYELTWSGITNEEKKAIAFDDSGRYAHLRASLNREAKVFLNSHFSDPMIYLGKTGEKIGSSVLSSLCWMTHGDWNDYERKRVTGQACNAIDSPENSLQLTEDDYVIITHSLGSRIAIDALQMAVNRVRSSDTQQAMHGHGSLNENQIHNLRMLLKSYQNENLQIYMLANQLPLLELGREPAEVTGQLDAYCRPEGEKYAERFFNRVNVIAFSDPNDLLSYAIPPGYEEERLESRICPEVTNVILNIAQVRNLLGIGQVASPWTAHVDYDADARVVGLIADGIGNGRIDPLVNERCTWHEVVNSR